MAGWSVSSLPSPPSAAGYLSKRVEENNVDIQQEVNPSPLRTSSFHGSGLAVLRSSSSFPAAEEHRATFSHLQFSFPLKLIHPRTSSHNASAQIQTSTKVQHHGDGKKKNAVAALYIVSYGGGLVSGDQVHLDIDVGSHSTLLTLTQGSTKVFKMRQGINKVNDASHQPALPPLWTSQHFRYLVRPHALLLVLPDPVTPYASARYAQTQRFDLRSARTSSAVVLDWFTPGRVYYSSQHQSNAGELWAFGAYSSRNEFRIGGKVVARDVLLLENPLLQGSGQDEDDGEDGATQINALAHAMHPFAVYASLFLYAASEAQEQSHIDGRDAALGNSVSSAPAVQAIIAHLQSEFTGIEQRRTRRATPVFSPWSNGTNGQNYPASASPHSADAVHGEEGTLLGHVLWSLSDIPFTTSDPPHTSAPSPSQPEGNGNRPPGQAHQTPEKHSMVIVRIAGTSTEAVRRWLALRMTALKEEIGSDLYKTALQ
ncbi:hypothetical protein OC846_005395 [Tilletia horrida]|uniref:Urease accessory protein UreD n=1 Tax=Tilletia horrida TaxID=155126 RepID=A0AAN6GLV8_9BASI|nr:hypothetical protein OC846_005395 [Tilletia horrida]KAK0561840.1 hypothetical protein OC861_005631 [Tilletia horrida]